ncbi:unnamed protein product [Durusdinium trenchii]|uniref:Uncharacterized protein n=1 Tax=Durusdinium trenchii TaxID=1381693 RepID=A0ABP0I6K6_9DINO
MPKRHTLTTPPAMPTRLALHVLLAAFHVVRGSVWAREDRGLSASTDVGDDSEDWFEEMLGHKTMLYRSFAGNYARALCLALLCHAGYAPDAALAAGDDHELIDELHYYHVLIDQFLLFKFYNDHHIFIVQLHIFNFYDDDHILIDQFFHFHDHDEHLLIDQLLHFNEDDHILIDQLYIFHIYHFGDKHNNQHFGYIHDDDDQFLLARGCGGAAGLAKSPEEE